MDINQTLQYLGKDNVIANIAMVLGFVQVIRCNNFLFAPLSTIFWAVIAAIIYSYIAELVVGITPEILKPLFSIILLMSFIYYVFFKHNCYDDRIKIEIKKCNPSDKTNTITIKPYSENINISQ